MQDDWFDQHSNYLKCPPLIREVSYQDFKSFYQQDQKNKGAILQVLESYCQEFRKDSYSQNIEYLLVNNNFLKKSDNNKNSEMNITGLLICHPVFKIDEQAAYKYFGPTGSIRKKYQRYIRLDYTCTSIHNNNDILNVSSKDGKVIDLSKSHHSNLYLQICSILLKFQEIQS